MLTAAPRDDAQILFLNKNDLFEKKVQHSPIKNFFPVSPAESICYTWLSADHFSDRITKVSQVIPGQAAITSSVGLLDWLRKPTQRNGRSTYSWCLTFPIASVLTLSSITTATDTAMLRVVMAAVEGE